MRARHIYPVALAGLLLLAAVGVGATVLIALAGQATLFTYLPCAVEVTLTVAVWRLLPRRPARELRTAAVRALYLEADRLITAMPPLHPYRADAGMVLLRTPSVLKPQVLCLDSADLGRAFTAPVLLVAQAFTLMHRAPLVHRDAYGLRVTAQADGSLTFRTPGAPRPRLTRLRAELRATRLVRTVGVCLATPEELRTLVEQLRIATPFPSPPDPR